MRPFRAASESLPPLASVGIGSEPFVAGKNSCKAIFKFWDIPFWPQYPNRSIRENFLFQFLSFFPGLKISGRRASFDEKEYRAQKRKYQRKLDRAFSNRDFHFFEPPADWAKGYAQMKLLLKARFAPEKRVIKLQITGPGTVWNAFFKKGISPKHARGLRQDLRRSLTAAGLAQIERIKSHKRVPLIFIDEPLHSNELSELRQMIRVFKNFGALVGLHVCSQRDWRGYRNLKIDLFHFDMTVYRKWKPTHRIFLRSFLKAKREIAWGVVPTVPDSDFKVRNFSSFLVGQLKRISTKDLPLKAILRRSLIAPACGMGMLRPVQSQSVYECVRRTAKNLRRELKLA